MSNNEVSETAILLISCPDEKGIIAVVTDFINKNGGNIVYLDQHVDRLGGKFFMRVEWELQHFSIPSDRIEEYFKTLYAERYQMNFRLYFNTQVPRMALFVSKMSHCLYDILGRYRSGELKVEIPLIVSNHEMLKEVAQKFDIPYYHFPISKENKAQLEPQEIDLLHKEKIDFVVLARYMQIISEEMIREFPNRIINIHHSFLPAFIGSKPYHQAFERGVKLIGATSHYVTEDLDAGPIIEQDVARISHKDTVENLIHKGEDLEKIVLSRAVEKHVQHKILVSGNKTIVFS